METKTLDLNAQATQTAFGELVGCSQQAIAERVKTGRLSQQGTFGDWLLQYCEQMRIEAAGRSGDTQQQLTMARIDESRENAAWKRQQRLKESGSLLVLPDIQNLLMQLPMVVHTSVQEAADAIREQVNSKHQLALGDEIDKPIAAALRHIADRARQLQETFGVDGAGDTAKADSPNSGVG